MLHKYTVIDLFSGCGGMSHGFIKEGFDVLLGIDNWKDALATFEHNHKGSKTILADLSIVSPESVGEKIKTKKVDVIIGGPPCQGFSVAGKRKIEDERNKLYSAFVDFVSFFQPCAFVMENVPNIISLGGGIIRKNILSDFKRLGYNVVYKVLTASDYGVPQKRRRAVFVGLNGDREFVFPSPSHSQPITSSDAISDLPENSVQDGSPYPIHPLSGYQKLIRNGSGRIYNHETTKHDEKTVKIISMVPDGGNYKNLPKELQNLRNVHIAWTRLDSRKPSFTIDTGHRHHFHYLFNRIPTVRESARIQSFPDDFIFLGSKTSQYKQVGNAVPPMLAMALANTIKKTLESGSLLIDNTESNSVNKTNREDLKFNEKESALK